jgi:phospholipid/cholesterol/gamma-HCH transport system ATP-binding protein
MADAHVVEVEGLVKALGGKRVLDGVDFSLSRGERAVVLGLSGSGKTVLVNHILGFLKLDKGKAALFGEDVAAAPPSGLRRLRRRMGVLFQENALFDSLSVEDNLLFPLSGAPRAEVDAMRARLPDVLAGVGLSKDDLARFPSELSGGMKKRVSLARAFAAAPELAVFDEPTTGLDPASASHVLDSILAHHRAHPDLASITVTHDYLFAARMASSIYFLTSSGTLEKLHGPDELEKMRREYDDEDSFAGALRGELEKYVLDFYSKRAKPASVAEKTRTNPGEYAVRFFEGVDRAAATVIGAFHPPGIGAFLERFYRLGAQSFLPIALSGFVVGLISTLQTALAMEPVGYEQVPRVVGVVICHHIGALFTGLFLAGRVGASIASEFGARRLSRQYEALLSFGLDAERLWLAPVFYAALAAFAAMAFIFELFAFIGGATVFTWVLGQKYVLFRSTFLIDVRFLQWFSGMLKAVIFGGTVAVIAYRLGIREKPDSARVGIDTTSAVVASLVTLIVIDLGVTLIVNIFR